MKLIGITQRLEKMQGYDEIREQLDVKWGELLLQCGYMPIILTSSVDIEAFLEKVPLQGVILSGGNDLSSLSHREIDEMRDDFEKKLLEISIKKKIPVLGVCRGMQVIGEFFGAELVPVENHVRVQHMIHIQPNTVLHKVIHEDKVEVNSYHNYSVKEVDKSQLEVLALSEDGRIEAIKHKVYPIVAHMWHPERERPFKETDIALIREIFHK